MKTQTCKTAAVMNLLSRGPGVVPAEPAGSAAAPAERTIEEITADILRAQVDGGRAVLTIGNGLIEAKGKLNHGEWLDWLTENVGYSEKNAENYMRIARNYSNPQLVADLGMRKALSLLALPETERDSFVAEANVVDMTSRELEKAVRERAEALEAKAKAETELKTMEDAVAKTMTSLDQANSARDALQKELDELKARPVEVAVEVDQAAIDKARAEGEAAKAAELAAVQEKLDKEKEKSKKLKAELDVAAQGRAHAESALGEAQAKLAAAAKPANPSPLSTDADLAQFKLLFDQAQGIVNQLHGLLLRVRNREDKEQAGKLSAALKALSESVGRCAE